MMLNYILKNSLRFCSLMGKLKECKPHSGGFGFLPMVLLCGIFSMSAQTDLIPVNDGNFSSRNVPDIFCDPILG